MAEFDEKLNSIFDYVVNKVSDAMKTDQPLRDVRMFLPLGRTGGQVRWPLLVVTGKRVESEPVTSPRSMARLILTFALGDAEVEVEEAVTKVEELALALVNLFESATDWPDAVMDLATHLVDLRASPFPEEAAQPWAVIEQTWRFEYQR